MPVSKLLKLAQQGDTRAIATLINEKLEPKGIWAIVHRHNDCLDIVFEALKPPPQQALEQFALRGLTSLKPMGLRSMTLHGRCMGESRDRWHTELPLPYLAPPPSVQPEVATEALAEGLLETSSSPPTAAIAPTVHSASRENQDVHPTDTTPTNLLAAARRGEKGAITTRLIQALADTSVIVRTDLMGTCLQVNLSAAKPLDKVRYQPLVNQVIHELALPFVEWVRIQGFLSGHDRALWSVEYDPRDPKIAPDYDPFAPKGLDAEGQKSLLIGLTLGLGLKLWGLGSFVLSYFVILVHELGHAIAYWLFGYIAIPSFNFLHGGGITLALGRLHLITIGIIAGFLYLCYRYRRKANTQRYMGSLLLLYCVFAFSPLHRMLITAMGHGGEVLAIAICFYFLFGKYYCIYPGERTLFAMLGWFSLFSVQWFSLKLIFSDDFRLNYFNGIGDGLLDNDLVILMRDYRLFNVGTLALILLILATIIPAIAWLAFRYERTWFTQLMIFLTQDEVELKQFANYVKGGRR